MCNGAPNIPPSRPSTTALLTAPQSIEVSLVSSKKFYALIAKFIFAPLMGFLKFPDPGRTILKSSPKQTQQGLEASPSNRVPKFKTKKNDKNVTKTMDAQEINELETFALMAMGHLSLEKLPKQSVVNDNTVWDEVDFSKSNQKKVENQEPKKNSNNDSRFYYLNGNTI